MKKGLFIAVEGGDFSGKTTFVKQLKEVLGLHDFSSVLFRSPGGDENGEKIRELLVSTKLSEEVRTLIFAANRVHSTQNLINPLTKKGINVISTRWRWSADAYQDNKEVSDFADEKLGVAKPDVYILLECSDEVMKNGFNKCNPDHPDYDKKSEELDVLDEEYTENYQQVKANFQASFDAYDGTKYKFVYNQGKLKPPTNEEFIELIKPFLTDIGYFEVTGESTIDNELVHDAIFYAPPSGVAVDESLFPVPRV